MFTFTHAPDFCHSASASAAGASSSTSGPSRTPPANPLTLAEPISGEAAEQGGFVCAICTSIISDPIETACCGNLSCFACDTGSRAAKSPACCPHCREPATGGYKQEPRRSIRARRQIQDLQVRCTACGANMTFGRFRDHVDNNLYRAGAAACKKLARFCPNNKRGCVFVGVLAEVEEHVAKTCERGHRLLDEEAVRVAGGQARLCQNLSLIRSLLGQASGDRPPISPSKIQEILESGQVFLSSTEFWSLDRMLEQGKGAVPASSCAGGILAHALPRAASDAKKQLLADYRGVLKFRVVDDWNLQEDADMRESPADIERRGVKRCRDSVRATIITPEVVWRSMFFEDLPEEKEPRREAHERVEVKSAVLEFALKNAVLKLLRKEGPGTGVDGVGLAKICAGLGATSLAHVKGCLARLLEDGDVYQTIDDDHFLSI